MPGGWRKRLSSVRGSFTRSKSVKEEKAGDTAASKSEQNVTQVEKPASVERKRSSGSKMKEVVVQAVEREERHKAWTNDPLVAKAIRCRAQRTQRQTAADFRQAGSRVPPSAAPAIS